MERERFFMDLNNHEKEIVLDLVVKILEDKGPLYVNALYETVRREHHISFFKVRIFDLVKLDQRLILKGDNQELVALREKTMTTTEKKHIKEILGPILDFFENSEKYSWNDVEYLCTRIKSFDFKRKTVIDDIMRSYKKSQEEVLGSYM